jgi:hypothetical protein
MARSKANGVREDEFLNSDMQPTEAKVDELGSLTVLKFDNDSTIEALKKQTVKIVELLAYQKELDPH